MGDGDVDVCCVLCAVCRGFGEPSEVRLFEHWPDDDLHQTTDYSVVYTRLTLTCGRTDPFWGFWGCQNIFRRKTWGRKRELTAAPGAGLT